MSADGQQFLIRRGEAKPIRFYSPDGDTAAGMNPAMYASLGQYPRVSPAVTWLVGTGLTVDDDPDSILFLPTRAQTTNMAQADYNFELWNLTTNVILASGVLRLRNPVRATI